MFEIWIGSSAFNQPVAAWDVGQVTKMSVRRRPRVGSRRGWGGCGAGGPLHATVSPTRRARAVAQQMFKGASAFNQPVEAWDVGKVTSMAGMFLSASAFNQPVEAWDVSQVINMASMFTTWTGSSAFNQPLAAWDVGQVTSMASMFAGTYALSDCNKLNTHRSFEAQIPSTWHYDWASVSCTTPLLLPPPESPPEPPTSPPSLPPPEQPPTFSDTYSLQVALGEWCADAAAAQATHGPISAWDVSAVTYISLPYVCQSTFNEDLNTWDVRQVTNMEVRRCPRREPEGLGWLAGGRSFATGAPTRATPCACGVACGAGNVRLHRFQRARGSMGRWPRH